MSWTVLKRLVLLPLLLVAVVPVLLPARVVAQNFEGVCQGVEYTGDTCDNGNEAETSINNLIQTGLEIFAGIVGVAAILMIIYAGFRYITAGGDASRISGAQQTIIYSLVGLVVAALAQIIAVFVVARTT